jgi:hypothetical protein
MVRVGSVKIEKNVCRKGCDKRHFEGSGFILVRRAKALFGLSLICFKCRIKNMLGRKKVFIASPKLTFPTTF